jgi:Zn-dependent M16 (insulinase) family peptidase
MTEVGVNGHDYLTTQAHQAAVTGGISAGSTARGDIDDPDRLRAVMTLSGKALARNQTALTELLFETFSKARFDELPRLRELVAQWRAQRQQSITGHGHLLAMNAAGAALSPVLALSHRWDGLASISALKALDDSLEENPQALAAMAEKLKHIAQLLQTAPRQMLVVSEAEQHESMAAAIAGCSLQLPAAAAVTQPFQFNEVLAAKSLGWTTTTQVSFCAKAYPTVALDHADAPALQVLGNYLRNGYLHRAVREKGGAYGVSAGYHGDSGTFRLFSYRDPRFEETFADFDQALDWLKKSNHGERMLEEAILGVISAIDRPGSPAGEAITAFYAGLFGRTPEFRRRFRRHILEVSLDDLKRVADTYLLPERASQAAISSSAVMARQQGWEVATV